MNHEWRVGVEAFAAGYGPAFQVADNSPQDVECEVVENDGAFVCKRPAEPRTDRRLAFVDGVRRTDARLTLTDPEGATTLGLAGSWAVGAVLIEASGPARVDRATVEHVAIFGNGHHVDLPGRNGWSWQAESTEDNDPDELLQNLQRKMREAEGALAEELAEEGWLTVVDGPLHHIRSTRRRPVVGYVKTHHRRILPTTDWSLVPTLQPGERSSAFAFGSDIYGCYLRIGATPPWAGPWAGIARLEVPSGTGREDAIATLDLVAGILPRFATSLHRDARAPVNLSPISGLERRLRRMQGDARLRLRAIREAVLAL